MRREPIHSTVRDRWPAGEENVATASPSRPWHAGPMHERAPIPAEPTIDIVDESFIAVRRPIVAGEVARRWESWWPDLNVQVYMDRGDEGLRWTVAGRLVGSSELWLEEHPPGVIVHYYLRAEPTVPGSATTPRTIANTRRARAQVEALRRRHVLAWKQVVWALKDELEADAHSHR